MANALQQVIRDVGPVAGTDARRLQGMVNDVLGAQSQSRRTEVHAVVVAAQESIPRGLLAGDLDVGAAHDRLCQRGIAADVAASAIHTWRVALGTAPEEAEPTSLGDEIPPAGPFGPALTEGAFAPPTPPGHGGSSSGPWSAPHVEHVPDANPAGDTTKSRWLLVAVPALVVALVIAVVAVTRGGDDTATTSPSSTVAASTSVPPTSTQPATTTTTLPPAVEAQFAPAATPLGDVTRSWVVDEDELVGTLVISNTTAADTAGRYYEVIPKSLAATADLIASEPAHVVIKNDPVIAWDVVVAASKTVEITYRLPVEADVTPEQLALWKDEQATAQAAFEVERTTPPALVVDTPNGIVIPGSEGTITGKVDPGAVLSVNGVAVAVNPDGSWAHPIAGLAIGPNAFTVTATNQYGTPASVTLDIIVEAPPEAAAPQAPTTTRAPLPPGSGTTVPPAAPTPPAVPTPAPPPPADTTTTAAPPPPPPPPPTNHPPTKKFDPTFTAISPCQFTVDDWTVYVLQAFTDPDGDPMSVVAVSPLTGSASPSPQGLHWIEPSADFVGSAIIGFTVSDGRGGTGSAALTITVPPGSQTC